MEWQEAVDKTYPFEFSMPLADNDDAWEFWVEGRKGRWRPDSFADSDASAVAITRVVKKNTEAQTC